MTIGLAASSAAISAPTLDEVNKWSRDVFVEKLGHLFEHSPWIARKAADRRPFADAGALIDACAAIIEEAGAAAQIELIRAHPDLAGKMMVVHALTPNSRREQGGAGLMHLTREEGMRFHTLNQAYRRKFGFPFVICARRNDKKSILEAFGRRLGGHGEEERRIAIAEIIEIARYRLLDMNIKGAGVAG